MPEIRHLLTIRTRPEDVYRALTETEGVRNWWTRTSRAESRIGSVAEFVFGDRYHNKMQIVNLDPNRLVEWLCLEGDPEWIGTEFTFDLQQSDEGTVLRFTHGNWREITDFYGHCNYHWGYYLRSLKLYCETGKGTPFLGEE